MSKMQTRYERVNAIARNSKISNTALEYQAILKTIFPEHGTSSLFASSIYLLGKADAKAEIRAASKSNKVEPANVEDASRLDIQIGADSTHEIIGYLYEGTEHAIPIRERRPGEPHKLTEEEKDLFRAAAIDGSVPIQDYLRIWYDVLNPEYRKSTGTN